MQDAFVGSWARQPHLSPEMLGSLHDLNHRFLDLIGARAGDWQLSGALELPGDASGQVAPLSAAQRAAAANCPYALFDLRFHDDSALAGAPGQSGPLAHRRCDGGRRRHGQLRAARALLRVARRLDRQTGAPAAAGHERAHGGGFPGRDAQRSSGARRERNGQPDRALVHERRLLERLDGRRVARGRSAAAQGPALRSAARGRRTPAVGLRARAAGAGAARRALSCGRSLARFSLRGSYARPRPSPAHQDLQKRHQGAQGHRSQGGGRRFLRAPGSERRRQNDGHRHRDLTGQQDQRHRRGVRPRPGSRARSGEVLHRRRAAGNQFQHVRDACSRSW